MIFLLSLALALCLVFALGKPLRKTPVPFYVGAAGIALLVVVCSFAGVRFPAWINTWVWPIFARGALAGALFVLVMVAGAFPNGSQGAKLLMPIRAQLSILACILTIAHNIAYGKTYFVLLFTAAQNLPLPTLLAAICSVAMDLLLLPLFITSFPPVRKRMEPKRWKRLQRWAYLFYALLCGHILLLTIPNALRGRAGYGVTVFVYTAVFVAYAVCRCMKARSTDQKTRESLPRRQMAGILCGVLISAALTGWICGEVRAERGGNTVPAATAVPMVTPEPTPAPTPEPTPKPTPEPAEELTPEPTTEPTLESTPETTPEPKRLYADGTFTGKGIGNLGTANDIEVSVTIRNDRIISITITGFKDDPEFFDPDYHGKQMIAAMLQAQSADVDVVSGASYSSRGLRDAVRSALEAAKLP